MRHLEIPAERHRCSHPDGALEAFTDRVCIEAPLHIHLNGEPFSVTLRSPGDDLALVRGFLHSEGIASNLPPSAVVQTGPNRVDVTIPEPFACPEQAKRRRLASNTSCGLCGNITLLEPDAAATPLPAHPRFEPARLPQLFETLAEQQTLFNATGGCHAAALFDAADQLLAFAEDIGRHNAVDKAIGQLLAKPDSPNAVSLLVSGRVSYEIAAKCWRAKVPVLAAVSAPTSLAVDLCQRFGMTLFGFCRADRSTRY